ncbi:hypothetical protein [Paenibacillus sp. YPG26]|uniref:hypothetical protein n=1 Tax=Paenibacillus sp. YPG26 TaxID=2878915 RepID=UPI00203AC6F5|nr:hypothetical protein [Paenibacillus sp. YPG26]USB34558.1 hypothetical protein LDO05_07290 [Paenibacillus sp. YPG26]
MSIPDENRKPGFNEIPDVDPNRPAATDVLEDMVDAIMNTGDDDEAKKNSQKKDNPNDDGTQLV